MEYGRIGFYNQNGEGLLRDRSCKYNLGESHKQSCKGCTCGPLRHSAAVLHVAHILADHTFLAGTRRQEMHEQFFSRNVFVKRLIGMKWGENNKMKSIGTI
jgi:hypothetical protein